MGQSITLRIVGSDLHHSRGDIGKKPGDSVGGSNSGVAAIDVGTAVLTAEHCPLGEYGKTVQGCRSGYTNHRIGQNPIVEGDINAVMVPVKGHRFYINISIDQLRTADSCIGGGFQQLLGSGG